MSVSPFVRLCQCGSRRTDLLEIWWRWGTPTIICRETPNLVKIGREYRARYVKTHVSFIVAGYLIRHKSIVVRHSALLHCWGWRLPQKHIQNVFFPFHGNKFYSKAPQCFVLLISPVFYQFLGRHVWAHSYRTFHLPITWEIQICDFPITLYNIPQQLFISLAWPSLHDTKDLGLISFRLGTISFLEKVLISVCMSMNVGVCSETFLIATRQNGGTFRTKWLHI